MNFILKHKYDIFFVLIIFLGYSFLKSTPASEEILIEKLKKNPLIVDVRTPQEVKDTGLYPNAINVPVDVLLEKSKEWDKNATIIVYCRSGNRSSAAKKMLEDAGFKDVYDGGAYTSFFKIRI